MKLRLRLLGSAQIERDDQIINQFRSRKSLALLGYLVFQEEAVSRSKLAAVLWPDKPESEGRRALRWSLSYLSKLLPDAFDATRQMIAFRHAESVEVDTNLFASLVSRGDTGALIKAAALYRDEFLANLYLDDCPEFELWLLQERQRWQQQMVEVLDTLVTRYLEQGAYDRGRHFAVRWLELEPWQEVAHRQLMRLLALSGQRTAALAQFETCRRILSQELDVEPLPETTTLYEQIKAGKLNQGLPEQRDEEPVAVAPLPASPYRGLFAFREEDAPFFFGREIFIERLVEATLRRSIVAVVGPSGSGKSSVVFAGLLPHLRGQESAQNNPSSHSSVISSFDFAQKSSSNFLTITFRPSSQPFQALARALLRILEPNASETGRLIESRKLSEALNQAKLSLEEVVGRILQKNPDVDHLLLVADQFEELYTLCPETETRQHFLDALLALITLPPVEDNRPGTNDRGQKITLLLTLRADFMGQALMYRPFADGLQDADIKLGPMTREELSWAIEKPARRQGVTFEPGLVDRILDDVGYEPGHLPLLEFALTALWEQQANSGGQLTHTAYQAIGRVEGALTHYANQVYTGLDQTEREQARRIFMQMIQPGEGTEDTRRLSSRSELGAAEWRLVQRLADTRLVVTNRDATNLETVEIVHEALIQNWDQLRIWLNEDRTFRVWQERLRVALRQWEESGLDEGALLRGALLAEAEEWAKTRADELHPMEQGFILASVTLRDEALLAAEAQRQRELAQAQALAEAEHRRAETQARASRRLRWLAVALGCVFIVAVGAAIFAFNQQQEAERQTHLAAAGQLATQAEAALAAYPQRSLLLALEALNATLREKEPRLPAAEQALRQALANIGGQDLRGHQGAINALVISPDNRWLVTGSEDQTVRLWDLGNPTAASIVLSGHQGAINALAISPDNHWLASGSEDQTIRLWDLGNPTAAPLVLSGHQGPIWALAISPDSRWLASGSEDQTVRLWDLQEPTVPPLVLSGHQGAIETLAISPDSRWLASGSQDQTARLWDLSNPTAPPLIRRGHTSPLSAVAFSPDSRWLVTAGASGGDNNLRLWDLTEPTAPPLLLSGHTSGINALAFSPDGRRLVTAGDWPDNTARLWAVDNPTAAPLVLTGHQTGLSAAAISPDNHWLVTASFRDGDNTARLWDLTNPTAPPLILRGHDDYLTAVVFSPDSRRLVTAGEDAIARLWELSEPTRPPEPLILTGHQESILALAFSPDNRWLVSGSGDSSARLWELSQPDAAPIILQGHQGPVNGVAVSSDNRWLVTSGQDSTVRLWNLTDPTATPLILRGHEEAVWTVAFSPDNRWLASGSTDQTVRLWNVTDPTAPPQVLSGHENVILAVAFSPDNRWLASGSMDRSVRLWDVTDLSAAPIVLSGHEQEVSAVAFSSDSHRLASGSWDKTVRLWDMTDLSASPVILSGHDGGLSSVAFSPDNHWLATTSGDKTARLWDLTDLNASPVILSGHETVLSAAAFSPDNHWLATGSWDKTIRLWNLHLPELMELACQTANRNLTDAEWGYYFRGQSYRPTCPDLPAYSDPIEATEGLVQQPADQ